MYTREAKKPQGYMAKKGVKGMGCVADGRQGDMSIVKILSYSQKDMPEDLVMIIFSTTNARRQCNCPNFIHVWIVVYIGNVAVHLSSGALHKHMYAA